MSTANPVTSAPDLDGSGGDNPRSRQKAERTGLLLRQAARLFARKGFRGVSLEEIASEVGISGPALYRHFSNKVAILSAVLEDVSVRLLEGGRARVAAASSPREALEALVDFHADFALGETDRIRVHNRDLATLPEESSGPVRRAQRDYVELWVDQLVLLGAASGARAGVDDAASDMVDSDKRPGGAGATADDVASGGDGPLGSERDVARLKAQAAIGLLNSTPHSVRHGDPEAVKPVLVHMTLAALLS